MTGSRCDLNMKCFSFPGNSDILHTVNSCTFFLFFKTKLSHPRTLWFFLQLTALLMTLWRLLVFWNKLTLFPPWGPGPSFSFSQRFPQISAQLMCSFGLRPNVTAQRGGPSWVTDSCVCPQIRSPSVLQHNVVSRADSGVRYLPLGPQLFIRLKLGLVSSSVKWGCRCNL